jgi:hypothetical protein
MAKQVARRIRTAKEARADDSDFNKLRRLTADCTVLKGIAQHMHENPPDALDVMEFQVVIAELAAELKEAQKVLKRHEDQQVADTKVQKFQACPTTAAESNQIVSRDSSVEGSFFGKHPGDTATIQSLVQWPKKKNTAMRCTELAHSGKSKDSPKPGEQSNARHTRSFVTKEIICSVCETKGHAIHECKKFQKLNPTERLQMAKDRRLHFRCLTRHGASECPIPSDQQKCPKDPTCKYKHHPLLHGADQVINADAKQYQGSTMATMASFPSTPAKIPRLVGPMVVTPLSMVEQSEIIKQMAPRNQAQMVGYLQMMQGVVTRRTKTIQKPQADIRDLNELNRVVANCFTLKELAEELLYNQPRSAVATQLNAAILDLHVNLVVAQFAISDYESPEAAGARKTHQASSQSKGSGRLVPMFSIQGADGESQLQQSHDKELAAHSDHQ